MTSAGMLRFNSWSESCYLERIIVGVLGCWELDYVGVLGVGSLRLRCVFVAAFW